MIAAPASVHWSGQTPNATKPAIVIQSSCVYGYGANVETGVKRRDRITSHWPRDESMPWATDSVICNRVGCTTWNGMIALSVTRPTTADQNIVVSARSVAVMRRVRITPIDQNRAERTRYSASG